MSHLEGVILGDYQLEKRLSRGGIADVYYGYRDGQKDVEVAIKVFHSRYAQQLSFRTHVRSQVEMIGNFDHPHILPLLEYGEGEGLAYVVTPYMGDGTLEDLLLRVGGRFSALQALPIVQQLCDAVQYVHDRHTIHGNIKPTNVLISPQGGMLLADFGMAGDYAEGQQSLTQIGWGAAEYTAPEQSLGVVQPESDIYALGALLFTLLTGVPPFTGQTPVEVLLKHVRQQPPLARELVNSISGAVDDVIQQALRKRPHERFPSATALRDAFAKAVSIAPVASPRTGPLLPQTPVPSQPQTTVGAGPHTPLPFAQSSSADSDLKTEYEQGIPTPMPFTATPVPPMPAIASAGNRPFKHIALKRVDESVQIAAPSVSDEEQNEKTAAHSWNFLLDERKNGSDEALFWSADPAEWSPIGDISVAKAHDEPLTAEEYLQRKPVVSREESVESIEPKAREHEPGTKLNATLQKWLPFIIVALLLLGLLGALCSAFL